MLTMTGRRISSRYTLTNPAPSRVSEPEIDHKLSTGAPLMLDGDCCRCSKTLYKEISAKHELQSTFEDMAREIQHIIEQMTTRIAATTCQRACF